MNRNETSKILAGMSAIFPSFKVEDKTSMLTVWTKILEPFDYPAIENALMVYARTNASGFAPSTGQLIDICVKQAMTDYQTPEQAWVTVYKALCNSGSNSTEEFNKLPEVIQDAIGSPRVLREWAMGQDNIQFLQRQFQESYSKALGRVKTELCSKGFSGLAISQDKVKMIEGACAENEQ